MGSPRSRLDAVGAQLQAPANVGTFENIPKIRTVAGESAGPRCKDKVVIITGCNSLLGIGRAAAHQFAANGARAVYMCDFSGEHLATHVREISSLYPNVTVKAKRFDAADEASVKGVIDEALRDFGRLDVFFANAGVVGPHSPLESLEVEDFEKTMHTNVTSVMLALKHASPAMQVTSEAKPYPVGSIVATASVAGLRSNAGGVDYSASKAAVVSLVQTSSYALQRTGVRCNAVCPGLIETGMTEPVFVAARARGTEKRIGQINPLGRAGVADEIARVALFLGSDESSYVNGQAWAVCGGLSAGHPYVFARS